MPGKAGIGTLSAFYYVVPDAGFTAVNGRKGGEHGVQ